MDIQDFELLSGLLTEISRSAYCCLSLHEISTTPLYNETIMFYRGVVTTSPNQDATRCFSMPFRDVTLLGDSNVIGSLYFPHKKNQNATNEQRYYDVNVT